LAACGKQAPDTAPASQLPEEYEAAAAAKAAREAKEAAYRKHLDAGTKALAAGNTDEAVTSLKQALGEKPDGAEAHYQFGRIALAKKDDAEALKALSEAIRFNPDHADAYFERAALHERAGRLNDASFDYRKIIAIEVSPKVTARAYWLRGGVMDRLGKRDDYRFDREQALRLDPDYQTQLTSGDVRVFNHTEDKLTLAFDDFVNADGSIRKFPKGFLFPIPGDNTSYLLDGNKQLVARSVRYTVASNRGSPRTYTQTYEKGMTFEIHIWPAEFEKRP
jgi:tetratricopeptide (TPR) repeat protein